MMRARWIIGGLVAAAGLALGIAGCGGDGGRCFQCEQQSFQGTYDGSGINSAGLFSVDLTISRGGAISGSETQLTGGTGTSAVTGSTDNNGNATITVTPTSGAPIVETGALGFAAPGIIQVLFYPSGSNTAIPVSMANSAGLYSGNYSGTYSLTPGSTGTTVVAIDVNGNISGTFTPTAGVSSTVSGTVNSNGVASVTIQPTGGSPTTYTGGAAYNQQEQLLVTAVKGNVTLSMSLGFQSNVRHFIQKR